MYNWPSRGYHQSCSFTNCRMSYLRGTNYRSSRSCRIAGISQNSKSTSLDQTATGYAGIPQRVHSSAKCPLTLPLKSELREPKRTRLLSCSLVASRDSSRVTCVSSGSTDAQSLSPSRDRPINAMHFVNRRRVLPNHHFRCTRLYPRRSYVRCYDNRGFECRVGVATKRTATCAQSRQMQNYCGKRRTA